MGNSQSQDSDNEHGKSTYNYHETVLREAQQLYNTSSNSRGYESDDQYFSAEEGEESDRSVTPQRTRPESSSGEDFSDDSESDVNRDIEGNQEASQPCISESSLNLVNDSQTFLSPTNKRLLTVKKSCGQCNVSRFQEHDSIGPELDRSQWDMSANNISVRTTRNSSQRMQEQNLSTVDNTGNDFSLRQTRWSHSPFKPINSPHLLNVSQRSTARNMSSRGKRKADQSLDASDEEESNLSPKRRHALRVIPNKRRLAMLDDSGSESDDNVKVIIKKKPRQSVLSTADQQFGSPSETVSGSLKRSLVEHDDDNVMAEEAGSTKKRKFCLGTKKLNVVGEKRSFDTSKSEDSTTTMSNSPKIKALKTESDKAQSEISDISGKPLPIVVVKRLQGSAFQPLNGGSNTVVRSSQQEPEQVSKSNTKTMKMGNDAVRNSLGKVLPIRYSQRQLTTSLPSSNTNVSDPSPAKTSQSDSALLENQSRDENLISQGSSTASGINVIGREFDSNQTQKRKSDTTWLSNSNNNQSASNAPIHTINDEDDNNSNVNSPFHNIVLTPPNSSISPSRCSNINFLKRAADNTEFVEGIEHFSTNNKNDSSDNAMETDESQPGIDSMETQPYTPRHLARAKRGFAAAKRLKNFFTEGSLKSNLKTLFSRKKSVHDRESHSNTSLNQTSWSLYSSPSSSLFGQSQFSNQSPAVFQSTSSPIDTVRPLSDNRVNFSPNFSNVAAASPLSVDSSGFQRPKLSTSTSSLFQGKRDTIRKSPSVSHLATRTSPRLRRTRQSDSSNATDTSALNTDSHESLGLHASSADILLLPQTSEFQVLHYRLFQTLEISLAMGDIAEESSSGIVNWTDGALTHTATECSRRICAKAGALMRAGCNSYVENKDGALEAPDVLTTPAGGRFPRSVKSLLHVVSPLTASGSGLASCLLEVNANCLRFASERLCLDSLSMPLIGEGELPTQLCAEAFIDAVLIFITEKRSPSKEPSSPLSLSSSSSASLPGINLSSIRLMTFNANVTDQAVDTIQARIDHAKKSDINSVVAEIHRRYYSGHDDSSLEETRAILNETTDRAISGRPRVKRPRL